MSKPLLTALAAVFGLSTLAGCHHHNRGAEAYTPVAEAYTPVAEAPPPVAVPVYTGKYR